MTATSNSDIRLGEVTASEAAVLTATGSILEGLSDTGAEVSAGATSTLRALTGTVGDHRGVDVAITNAALRVEAGGQQNGVSIRIDGMVSPSNSLILLSSPPGQVLFNAP